MSFASILPSSSIGGGGRSLLLSSLLSEDEDDEVLSNLGFTGACFLAHAEVLKAVLLAGLG
jgi:hypothetical protein